MGLGYRYTDLNKYLFLKMWVLGTTVGITLEVYVTIRVCRYIVYVVINYRKTIDLDFSLYL